MLLVLNGRHMITRKALKTSIAPITKQPTSEQAQHHWHNADQLEFPDQPLKPSFNPSRGHGSFRSKQSPVSTETQNKPQNESCLRQTLIIKIQKSPCFTCCALEIFMGCCCSCEKAFFEGSCGGPRPVQAPSEISQMKAPQCFGASRTCCRHRYAMQRRFFRLGASNQNQFPAVHAGIAPRLQSHASRSS